MMKHAVENAAVVAALLVLALLLWYGALFNPTASWDENIFFLMAQDVARGHLPYVHLWDLKPPLMFWLLGLFYSLWPTVWGMRALQMLYIVVTAWVLYLAGRRFGSRPGGMLAAVAWVLLSAVLPNVTAEHLAALPLALCMLIVLRGRMDVRSALLLGLLVSLASLIRTNLFMMLPFIWAALWLCRTQRTVSPFGFAVLSSLAFALPHVLVFALYALKGHWHLIWATQVLVPLAYPAGMARTAADLPQQLPVHFVRWLIEIASQNMYVLLSLVSTPAALFALWPLRGRERRTIAAMLVLQAGILFSIMLTGRPFLHYWIQYFPLAAWLLGVLAAIGLQRGGIIALAYVALGVTYAFLAIISPKIDASGAHWRALQTRPLEQLYYEYDVAARLRREGAVGQYMLSCDQPVFAFLSDAVPATRYAARQEPYMYALVEGRPYQFLADGMSRQPRFIIDRPGDKCLQRLASVLDKDYKKIFENGGTVIYKRKE